MNNFDITGTTYHFQIITGLASSNAYTYYIRCQDTSGNANTDDYVISFAIGAAPPPPNPPLQKQRFSQL